MRASNAVVFGLCLLAGPWAAAADATSLDPPAPPVLASAAPVAAPGPAPQSLDADAEAVTAQTPGARVVLAGGEAPPARSSPGARRLEAGFDVGARVRLTSQATGVRTVGWLTDVDDEAFFVRRLDGSGVIRLERSSVARFERYHGRRSKALTGATVGLFVPGVPLAIYGMVLGSMATMDCESGCSHAPIKGGVLGLAAGVALGALVGAAITTDHWEKVPLNRVRFGIAPRRGGVAVGLAWRF